ncbi:hypothetical protein ACOSQ4_014748 [Xanthoceras sorbifolium]
MVNPIPENVKKIWDEWNIRGVILLSLSLQAILFLFASLRKTTANKLIILLIWSVYLLADWSAIFALGLISNSLGDNPDHSAENTTDLLASWTPFLFLHLGGPDNITAFALEDNELWFRHFVGLLIQALAALYIFLLSFPKTKLAIPTILLFVAGSIKYLERTRAFYLASFDGFQDSVPPDPGPNYAKFMEEYHVKRKEGFDITIKPRSAESGASSVIDKKIHKLDDEPQVVNCAYYYFQIVKGLIVNQVLGFRQYQESRDFFLNVTPEEAYKIIEVELNLIYEVLYTKIKVVCSVQGCIIRFISCALVVTAFSVFHLKVKNHGFDDFDVAITYTLFLGAISLDIMSLFILVSFDFTSGALKIINSHISAMLSCILNLKKPRWYSCVEHKHEVLATPFLFGRWSGYVSGHNLLSYCLKGCPTRVHRVKNFLHRGFEKSIHSLRIDVLIRITVSAFVKVSHLSRLDKLLHCLGLINELVISWLGLNDFVDGLRYVSHEPLTKELWKFIFDELREKSQFADNPEAAMKISSSRGEWILQNRDYWNILMPYVTQVTYDESLLLWHIATELLYQTDDAGETHDINREISKLLSDYMLYLLIIHTTMTSAVAGIAKIRFGDTCAETMKFFRERSLKPNPGKEACNKILAVHTDIKPAIVKGDRSKSVLFNASMLAKELKQLDDKWKLMSKIWVELLSYAACFSGSRAHAQQVIKGGELITFVWLLMAHFGLQQHFQNVTM